MANIFRPPFPLPPLRQSRTSSCDCFMNIRNAREELHNFVDKVCRMLTVIRLDIVKLIASDFIRLRLHFEEHKEDIQASSFVKSPQCHGFLWCNGELKRGKAKVVWNDICLPKSEGGLGIRSLELFNIALMTTHIWNIVSNKESLWVCWIHTPYFWSKIGNGRGISAWFDVWCKECPLICYPSHRDISREGFNLKTTIGDLVSNEVWNWPQSWLLKAPILGQILVPLLVANIEDTEWWYNSNGVLSKFSGKAAWEEFRPHGNVVPWHRIIWFSHNIPHHAFHLWLTIRKSLKTQDKLKQWDVGSGIDLNQIRCVFYDSMPDSHNHLFFECQCSSKIWSSIRHLAGMDVVLPCLEDIVLFFAADFASKNGYEYYWKALVSCVYVPYLD
ncbi:putative reverse transcriptase domain-containing protein [Tanacetum coccineum]